MSKISDFFYNGLNCEVAGKALDARQGIALMQTFNQFGESLSELGSRVSAVEGAGGGIAGTSYLYVAGKSTAIGNAAELQAAYNAAKSTTPYGAALSATNRVKIIVGAGTYTFASTFTLDAQYVDIVSLTGEADVMINGVSVTANDVHLKGVNCGSSAFTISTDLNLLRVVNCRGGDDSFGGWMCNVTGYFENCRGGDACFGNSFSSVSGTFINCRGGDACFGYYHGTASGYFENCQAGNSSFAGINACATGTFVNCISGNQSFGYASVDIPLTSGTFINCRGGDACFGAINPENGGITGTAINCQAGALSFGKIEGTALLFNCRLTAGSYPTPISGGLIRNCLDGNKAIINT